MVATGIQQQTKTSNNPLNTNQASEKIRHFGDAQELSFYKTNDARLDFTKTKDPVEVAWGFLDNKSVPELTNLYIKERLRNPMKKFLSNIM